MALKTGFIVYFLILGSNMSRIFAGESQLLMYKHRTILQRLNVSLILFWLSVNLQKAELGPKTTVI